MLDALDGAERGEHGVHDGGQGVGVALLLVDGDALPLGTLGLHVVLPEVALLLSQGAGDAACVLADH